MDNLDIRIERLELASRRWRTLATATWCLIGLGALAAPSPVRPNVFRARRIATSSVYVGAGRHGVITSSSDDHSAHINVESDRSLLSATVARDAAAIKFYKLEDASRLLYVETGDDGPQVGVSTATLESTTVGYDNMKHSCFPTEARCEVGLAARKIDGAQQLGEYGPYLELRGDAYGSMWTKP